MWVKKSDNSYLDLKTGHQIHCDLKGASALEGATIHLHLGASDKQTLVEIPAGDEAAADLERSLKVLEREMGDSEGLCDLSNFGRPKSVHFA